MRHIMSVGLAVALAFTSGTFADRALAGSSDAVIAGAAGFAVGTIVGGAAVRPYYHARYYRAYRPKVYRPFYRPRVYARAYYFDRPYNDSLCGNFRCR